MRTVFITPLLFQKLDRSAIRRGESGQAIVLIAFVAIGIVAMVGLAIDSGIGYLDATRLQRAADAAALAGVVWLPDNRTVGDARAQLAAEANGVKVACYYDSGQADTTAYNQRCRRTSYTQVTQNGPDQFYSFESQVPGGINIRYRVTLSKMEARFFLGILGFPSYPIIRVSTAEYFQRVIFGSSFNYYGSNGVLDDHYMRCDLSSLANCNGNSNTQLNMRGATYSKYVLMRCEQPNPPSPCIGGFWGHIAGQDLLHGSGDAYNPIRDGGAAKGGGGGVNGYSIGTNGGNLSTDCLHTNDPTTWFVNSPLVSAPGGGCVTTGTNPPVVNADTHPDAPNDEKGFGSEVIIKVDSNAIYSYTDTQANVANHTNLNVTIYDGAEDEQGGNETFNTADNFGPTTGSYGSTSPYSGWGMTPVTSTQNLTATTSWNSKTLICSPGTKALPNTSYCDSSSLSGSNPTVPRATSWDPSLAWNSKTITNSVDQSTRFPDNNMLELTYNDMRTRLTLYGPPPTPAIPSVYQNVVPYKIGQMELTDMSVRQRAVQAPIGCPQGGCSGSNDQRFCYFIFDDSKMFWDNTQFPDNTSSNGFTLGNKSPAYSTSSAKYFGPDYAYQTNNPSPGTTAASEGTPRNENNRYAYVCPTTGSGNDVRWNQLKGTPTARYGKMVDYDPANPNDRTIMSQILDVVSPTVSITPTTDIYYSPIVTGTLSNGANLSQADPETYTAVTPTTNVWTVPLTTGAGFQQVVDPNQDCRRSAIDIDSTTGNLTGYPIDSLWGHNRIPFNMAYGDPLVNRAWITSTTFTGNTPVATKQIAGYYTLYYSFHGWRCDWDFDSNYTADSIPNNPGTFNGRGNPLKDPTKMPDASTNPSLSLKERQLWGTDGQYDKAFVEGHPGLSTITYTTHLLKDVDGAGTTNSGRDFPTGTNSAYGFDRDFGLQPYFHLTNIAWKSDRSTLVVNPNLTAPTAAVRAGSYLLHIQTYGGAGANRYSVKAEYENPRTAVYTYTTVVSGATVTTTLSVNPVPAVFPLTAMTIYANAVNSSSTNSQQDVIFDLAYIPPSYAGTQAIVQLFDAGDVSGVLDLQILEPSMYGPKVNTGGNASPRKSDGTFAWSVPKGNVITTTLTACTYNLSQCFYNSLSNTAPTQSFTIANGNNFTQYYNDQWTFLTFKLPSLATYTNIYLPTCIANGVPENLCYFFQIDYQLKTANARANDTTTWQLLVQGQPVHLVDNQDQP